MDSVIMRESLVCGMTAWVKIYSFYHGGESYEYAFEIGSNTDPETQAEAVALRRGFALKAQNAFLRDVAQGEMH